MSTSFLLYSRSYCHLCDDMRIALENLIEARQVSVEIIDVDADVDADPSLLARYDEMVPVLMGRHSNGALQQLCHHFLDTDAVIAFIATSATLGHAS